MVVNDVKKTHFYKELTENEAVTYFNLKQKKIWPDIDNLYYSVYVDGDSTECEIFNDFLEKLDGIKQIVRETKNPVEYSYSSELLVELRRYEMYTYCLSMPDLYDIFILKRLPNDQTPRFIVQIRAYGLWVHGWEKLINDSFSAVERIIKEHNQTVKKVYENRVDYCYHTNMIQNPESHFSDRVVNNSLTTTFKHHKEEGRIASKEGKAILLRDYLSLGDRDSNYLFVRFYNKGVEVIQKGYKGYFFEIWYQHGLINFYDKFCFECAYKEKNPNAIHRGKLEFYLLYGKDEAKKESFRKLLNEKDTPNNALEKKAAEIMPECTKVVNIEFETKRLFYYLSDNQINSALFSPGNCPNKDLTRLYKIVNNRDVFIEWITSTSVSFHRKDGTYRDWWTRLRGTKLNCLNSGVKLIREYSNRLDKELMQRRLIGAVASNSVYLRKDTDGGFIENLADVLANINDNDKQVIVQCFDDSGELHEDMTADMLKNYQIRKQKTYKRVKNRFDDIEPVIDITPPMGETETDETVLRE